MPQLGELLERFRHTATPGPPAAAGGVPEDAAADLQAELRPLIAALDEIEDEARALVDAAIAEAAAVRERAAREAESITSDARLRAARLLATPPDETAGDDEEARSILARAGAEAEELRRRARSRFPGVVGQVVRCVRGGIDPGPDGPHPRRQDGHVAGVGGG